VGRCVERESFPLFPVDRANGIFMRLPPVNGSRVKVSLRQKREPKKRINELGPAEGNGSTV